MSDQTHVKNRWAIALAGVFLQMSLGAGYSWSVFRIPLVKQFGWTIAQASLPFNIAFFFLGVSTFMGGWWLHHTKPRVVAMTAGLLWGGGVFLASFSAYKLWLLYLTFGFLGGMGLGMGYIVPIAVLVKWFPDHRGFITGLAVMGFGAGALISAPISGRMLQTIPVMRVFADLGIVYGLVVIVAGYFLENPPEGWQPAGWTPSAAQLAQRAERDFSLAEAIRHWQWWALMSMMAINTMAGLSVISQEAPIFQEVGKLSALAAANFLAAISIGNALGRIFWSWFSDLTSRRIAFLCMYLLQAVLFWILHTVSSPYVLAACIFVVLTCYGGAYGIVPAFAADYFGPRYVQSIFGTMMLPWAFAAGFGPLLFAYMRQETGGYNTAFYIIATMLTFALILPIAVHPPKNQAQRTDIHAVEIEATVE